MKEVEGKNNDDEGCILQDSNESKTIKISAHREKECFGKKREARQRKMYNENGLTKSNSSCNILFCHSLLLSLENTLTKGKKKKRKGNEKEKEIYEHTTQKKKKREEILKFCFCFSFFQFFVLGLGFFDFFL